MSPGRGDPGMPSGSPRACDPEKVFELADGGLDPEERRRTREHVAFCAGCAELYEREIDLNAFLESLDFSGGRSSARSVSEGVAMALPTRGPYARLTWGLLAFSLLAATVGFFGFDGVGVVILAVSALSACWNFVVGSAEAARVILTAAGPAILYALALGALADVLIVLAVVLKRRGRQAQEA